jgi:hypothetical protein
VNWDLSISLFVVDETIVRLFGRTALTPLELLLLLLFVRIPLFLFMRMGEVDSLFQ